MNLIEFLNTKVEQDEYVYLGAASGYLWIGKPAEIIAKLPDLDADFIERIKSNIERNERYIGYKEVHIKGVEDNIRKGGDEYRLKRVKKIHERELKKYQNRRDRLVEQLENRVPFAEREVKDVYHKHLVAPSGTVVVIEGEELGDYWMLSEIENGQGVRESTESEELE